MLHVVQVVQLAATTHGRAGAGAEAGQSQGHAAQEVKKISNPNEGHKYNY
jgi:hypothetical protein